MSQRDFQERLESALEHLQGDTGPVRQLFDELTAALQDAQGELAGFEAACEGELAALDARMAARRESLAAIREETAALRAECARREGQKKTGQ